MKINEYNQMMAYLTKPDKKPVIPKSKPKKSTREAYKEYLEIRPFLDAESQMFIEKELGFAMGGSVETPKRGLVDEPGSYSQKSKRSYRPRTAGEGLTVTEINKYRKQGLSFEEILKKLSESLNRDVGSKEYRNFAEKNISKLFPEKSYRIAKNMTDERLKFLNKSAKKYNYKNYESVPDSEKKKIQQDATARQKGRLEGKGGKGGGKVPADDPVRFKEIKKFINNTKKTFGYLPTRAEIINHFKEIKNEGYDSAVDNYIEKTKIKLPKGISGGPRVNVDARIKKLLNSKTVTDILDEGRFPTNSIIKNILKVDPTTAGDAAFDLAKTLTGEKEIRFFEAPTKYKKIAQKYVTENRGNIFDPKKRPRKERGYYERGLTKLLNLPKNIALIRQDIVDKLKTIIPEMKNLSVDEIGSITTSMRSGSGPYAIFGQVIDKDFNTAKGSNIDASKGRLEKKLIKLNKDDPERLRLQKNYNERVNQFEFDANKNNPIKKVKGLKLSFEPPSKTVKNKKVYNQYKDLFDAHYDKYGYSFEVPADRDSIVDISNKLDNRAFQNTIKNRFTKLIGKGGKFGALVGLGTLAGTGFALADQPDTQTTTPVVDEVETQPKLPSFKDTAIGGTAAAVGSKFTKTDPLKKFRRFITAAPVRKGFGKILRGAGTPIAGPIFAGTNIYSKMKEGKSLGEAVMDPLTGLELAFPSLFTENVAKITTNPAIQRVLNLGGLQKVLGPAGVGIATVSSLKDRAEAMAEKAQDISNLKDIIQQQEKIKDFAAGDYRGYLAGGGIAKLAGIESGPQRVSMNSDSEGLASLLKRGK